MLATRLPKTSQPLPILSSCPALESTKYSREIGPDSSNLIENSNALLLST